MAASNPEFAALQLPPVTHSPCNVIVTISMCFLSISSAKAALWYLRGEIWSMVLGWCGDGGAQ